MNVVEQRLAYACLSVSAVLLFLQTKCNLCAHDRITRDVVIYDAELASLYRFMGTETSPQAYGWQTYVSGFRATKACSFG